MFSTVLKTSSLQSVFLRRVSHSTVFVRAGARSGSLRRRSYFPMALRTCSSPAARLLMILLLWASRTRCSASADPNAQDHQIHTAYKQDIAHLNELAIDEASCVEDYRLPFRSTYPSRAQLHKASCRVPRASLSTSTMPLALGSSARDPSMGPHVHMDDGRCPWLVRERSA